MCVTPIEKSIQCNNNLEAYVAYNISNKLICTRLLGNSSNRLST